HAQLLTGYLAEYVPVKLPLIELPSTVLLPRESSVAPEAVVTPKPLSVMVESETLTVAPAPSTLSPNLLFATVQFSKFTSAVPLASGATLAPVLVPENRDSTTVSRKIALGLVVTFNPNVTIDRAQHQPGEPPEVTDRVFSLAPLFHLPHQLRTAHPVAAPLFGLAECFRAEVGTPLAFRLVLFRLERVTEH